MPTFPSTLFPLRRRARIVIAAVLALSAAIAALLCFSGLRDFSLESATTRTLTFHAGSDRLSGTLILPRDVAAPPVALFVHGDGPQDRYADDGYQPFINQLLDQGIGVFTWDKPGVGRSAGNWLDQSMQDRAAEAMAAYLRVRSEPGVDAAKVGFLGYSQAGWVLPIVASRAQPAFTVIIGGAVNWRDQGAYYTRKRLQAQGVAADEIERRLAAERTSNDALFGEPRPLADVLAARPDMTPARARYVQRNYLSDASGWIPKMRGPVLAVWGEMDPNVDAAVNAARYRLLFADAPDKRVMLVPDAGHVLLRAPQFNDQIASDWTLWKSCASCCWAAKPTCSLPCATSPTGSGRPPPAIEDGPPCRRSNRFSADMEWPYHGRNLTPRRSACHGHRSHEALRAAQPRRRLHHDTGRQCLLVAVAGPARRLRPRLAGVGI